MIFSFCIFCPNLLSLQLIILRSKSVAQIVGIQCRCKYFATNIFSKKTQFSNPSLYFANPTKCTLRKNWANNLKGSSKISMNGSYPIFWSIMRYGVCHLGKKLSENKPKIQNWGKGGGGRRLMAKVMKNLHLFYPIPDLLLCHLFRSLKSWMKRVCPPFHKTQLHLITTLAVLENLMQFWRKRYFIHHTLCMIGNEHETILSHSMGIGT